MGIPSKAVFVDRSDLRQLLVVSHHVSTTAACIPDPDLSGVDLSKTQGFAVDKKARPRKRTLGDEWYDLIIGSSPYNRVSVNDEHYIPGQLSPHYMHNHLIVQR